MIKKIGFNINFIDLIYSSQHHYKHSSIWYTNTGAGSSQKLEVLISQVHPPTQLPLFTEATRLQLTLYASVND